MVSMFRGGNADELWRALFEETNTAGLIQSGRSGEVRELLHVVLELEDPMQKWVTMREPSINPAFALAELMWIANGQDESGVINFWNPALQKYAGHAKHYHGAYGARIRRHFGFDQLERTYEVLRAAPESRQTVIQIYDTEVGFPHSDGSPANEDVPCNVCSMAKIRNGALEWTQVMRSNDLIKGMPYNFVQYTGLQEILAGWLGVELGSYVHYADSCHVYERDKSYSFSRERCVPPNQDALSIPKGAFDELSVEIYTRMKAIANLATRAAIELPALAKLASGYPAYDNIMCIIAADAARRFGLDRLSADFVEVCENETYRSLWCSWARHRESRASDARQCN